MSHLSYQIERRVATIVLDNPPQNRIGDQMVDELAAAIGTPVTPSELEKDHNTIGMVYAQTSAPLPFVFAKDNERFELSLSHRLLVNDTNAYLAAGLAGLGVIQAPGYAVQSAIRAGQLVSILDDWTTDVIPIHIVFPPNRFLSAKVRVFIDWTVALFARKDLPQRQ